MFERRGNLTTTFVSRDIALLTGIHFFIAAAVEHNDEGEARVSYDVIVVAVVAVILAFLLVSFKLNQQRHSIKHSGLTIPT